MSEVKVMNIKKEINHAVKKIAAVNSIKFPKTIKEQEQIILDVEEAFEKSLFDFNKAATLFLTQKGKKRLVKRYDDVYSPENILCQVIKQILDREFKVKYPNRNKISHDLFTTFSAMIQMNGFTIVKFDFKDYFNSISSVYVFEKYLEEQLSDRREIDLIRKFVDSTQLAYAGLCTSNVIAEIIASQFDKVLLHKLSANGVIFYERYIDDCILIFNENMEESEVIKILKSVLLEVFYDKNISCTPCKTDFNKKKLQYVTRKNVENRDCSIDFLGYSFLLKAENKKIKVKYGITWEKRQKYQRRLDHFVSSYYDKKSPDYNDLELLRHRIAAFSMREVYLTKHFGVYVWRVKGFISNYGELRHFLGTDFIDPQTEDFMKTAVINAFQGRTKPYFLNCSKQQECGYNLYNNMKKNKTLLLVEHVGYDYKSLVALCGQIGINNKDSKGRRRGYGTLVRDYLIKVRVGY